MGFAGFGTHIISGKVVNLDWVLMIFVSVVELGVFGYIRFFLDCLKKDYVFFFLIIVFYIIFLIW